MVICWGVLVIDSEQLINSKSPFQTQRWVHTQPWRATGSASSHHFDCAEDFGDWQSKWTEEPWIFSTMNSVSAEQKWTNCWSFNQLSEFELDRISLRESEAVHFQCGWGLDYEMVSKFGTFSTTINGPLEFAGYFLRYGKSQSKMDDDWG